MHEGGSSGPRKRERERERERRRQEKFEVQTMLVVQQHAICFFFQHCHSTSAIKT
jgi:hypothetical protein